MLLFGAVNRGQQASLQAVFALDRVGGGLHFLSVCFVFVTGSSHIQRPQRGKPHQHHDRQAYRHSQRAGEHRGRDLCPPPVDVTAGVPGMDFFSPRRQCQPCQSRPLKRGLPGKQGVLQKDTWNSG